MLSWGREPICTYASLQLELAVERVNQVAKVTWIFLGTEAGLIIPLCAIYVFR